MKANHKKLVDLFTIRKEPVCSGSVLMSVMIYNGLVERDSIDPKTKTGLTPEEKLAETRQRMAGYKKELGYV